MKEKCWKIVRRLGEWRELKKMNGRNKKNRDDECDTDKDSDEENGDTAKCWKIERCLSESCRQGERR